MGKITFQQALKERSLNYYNKSIDEKIIDRFSENIEIYTKEINKAVKNNRDEENIKNIINAFLKKCFYSSEMYNINTKNNIDSAISKNGSTMCIIETKKYANKNEMLEENNINKKALHELIYYYLEETRTTHENKVKHRLDAQIRTLVATNAVDFFIFSDEQIENVVKGEIEEYYFKLKNNLLNFNSTVDFYNYVKKYLDTHKSILNNIDYVFFNMKSMIKDNKQLPYLYKILSKYYLLNEKYTYQVSTHTLNKKFYNELLYIMGLTEIKKNNNRKIIIDKTIENSFAYQLYNRFIKKEEMEEVEAIDKTFELLIIWLNRILFIKLFESQLISFNSDNLNYHILDNDKIKTFEDLDELFFYVLGKRVQEREDNDFFKQFKEIPYLNSSLFERQRIEIEGIKIDELKNDEVILKSDSILKNKQYNSLPLLEYIINFLRCYDFSSKELRENIKGKNKEIIDASVLGLIFEKINGYKDGSVYTPSQITEYMTREVVEDIILKRINNELKFNAISLIELKGIIRSKYDIGLYKKINNIINSITYCDPAVGSGHFLVSLLNRIIKVKYDLGILMYFDSNEIVREYNIYIEDDTLIIENGQGDPFVYNQNDVLSQKMQETLFNEKRVIIEKCLFGVDVNPKAVAICQLRLWIELLKNAYYKNHIMETLPNIDINIKSGDSLIHNNDIIIGRALENNIKIDKKLIKEYKNNVKLYKSSSDKNEKKKIKDLIERIKNVLNFGEVQMDLLEDKEVMLGKLKKSVIFENAFEWTFEFPEILGDNGEFYGFDCVIGNPPYIQIQSDEMKSESKRLEEMKYNVFERTGDIYCLFFELAKKLLKKEGILAFITSNKWLRAGYGEKLRIFLKDECNPIKLIDFSGTKVFEDVTVDVNILIAKNEKNAGNTMICKTTDKCLNNLKDFVEHNKNYKNFDMNTPWILTSDIEEQIKNKVEKYGKKLKEWNITINYGVKTGYNEAFIISGNTKNKLIEEDPKSAEIIRPILRGKDIKRYEYEFKDLWMIYIPCGYTSCNSNIENKEEWIIKKFPSIYKYLVKTEMNLSKERSKNIKGLYNRTDQGEFWWELRSCNYMDDFNKPKIVYQELAQTSSFYLDENGFFYLNNTAYFIVGEKLKYLTVLLNSDCIKYIFKTFYSISLGEKGIRWLRQYIDNLPIPIPSKEIEEKVCEFYNTYTSNPKISNKDSEQLIYSLYKFTDDEIKFIENKIKTSF